MLFPVAGLLKVAGENPEEDDIKAEARKAVVWPDVCGYLGLEAAALQGQYTSLKAQRKQQNEMPRHSSCAAIWFEAAVDSRMQQLEASVPEAQAEAEKTEAELQQQLCSRLWHLQCSRCMWTLNSEPRAATKLEEIEARRKQRAEEAEAAGLDAMSSLSLCSL